MKQSSDSVFVKLLKRDNEAIGHVVSSTGEFPKTEGGADESIELVGTEGDIESVVKSFFESMTIYMDFMPLVLQFVPLISSEAFKKSIEQYLEKEKIERKDVEDGTVYEISAKSYLDFSKLASTLQPSFDVPNTLARNVMMGMVAILDNHLAMLLKFVAMSKPEMVFASAESVSVKEVLECGDIQEFKDGLIRKEIEKVSWTSLADQVEWFEKKLKLDPISKNYQYWSVLGEIFQRRHLFAHTNGRVSLQYINNAKVYGYQVDGVQVGQLLSVGGKYYKEAVTCVFEFGIMLAHIVRKKIGVSSDDKIDGELNTLVFQLLQRGDYALANRLLVFAYSMRGNASDRTKKMIIVNYANSLRLCGEVEKSTDLLNQIDWSSVSDDFKICVAAVKGDVDEVIKSVREFGTKGALSEANYREWPAFFHVREDAKFSQCYEEVFGIPYRPSRKNRDSLTEIFANLSTQTFDLKAKAAAQ